MQSAVLFFGVKLINDLKEKTLQAKQKESVGNHDCYVDYLHHSDYTDYFFDLSHKQIIARGLFW